MPLTARIAFDWARGRAGPIVCLEMFPVPGRPRRTLISDRKRLKSSGESVEDLAQQKDDTADQAAEVVADSGEDGVGSIAPPSGPDPKFASTRLGYPCMTELRYFVSATGAANCEGWPAPPNSEMPTVDLRPLSNDEVGNADAICWDHSANF